MSAQATEPAPNITSEILAMIDSLPLGVVIANPGGRLVHMNSEAHCIWGEEAPLSAGIEQYTDYVGWWPESGEQLDPGDWALARALAGEASVKQVVDIQRTDGAKATIVNSAAPLRDEHGALTGAIAVFQDITEQRERQRFSEVTSRIGEIAASTLHAEEMLARVLNEASTALGASSAVLYTQRSGVWRVQEQWGELAEPIGPEFTEAEVQYSIHAQRRRQVLNVPDVTRDSRADTALSERYGVRALLDAPVTAKGRLAGNLVFHFKEPRHSFTEAQEQFVADVAFAIGRALTISAEYQGTEEVANALQSALVDLPASLPGISYSSSYTSAAEVARVGGDFYDLMPLSENRIAIILGDVSGKGLEAAKMMMMVKNSLRAYAFAGDSPNEVLRKANGLLAATTPSNMFVTVFLGVLDTRTGRLDYCSGGHPTALIRRANGDVTELSTQSPLVGAFRDLPFIMDSETLHAGDYLFLYSDGAIEASNGHELFGQSRLSEIVQGQPTPHDGCTELVDAVRRFAGGGLADDLAVLAVTLT